MKLKLPRLPRPHWPERPARLVSDLVDLAGLACLDTAAWWIHPVAGMAAAGAMLLLIGKVIDQ